MPYQLDPDSELPPHLVGLFLSAAPTHLEQVVIACAERDAERARLAAHKLKGGLYAAGASALAQDAEGLRATLAKGDWFAVARQLQAVRDDFARVVVALERRLRAGAG